MTERNPKFTGLTLLPPLVLPSPSGAAPHPNCWAQNILASFISHIHAHQEIILALPSKYTRNLSTSHYLPCYHSSSRCPHPPPGLLLCPPNRNPCICPYSMSKILSVYFQHNMLDHAVLDSKFSSGLPLPTEKKPSPYASLPALCDQSPLLVPAITVFFALVSRHNSLLAAPCCTVSSVNEGSLCILLSAVSQTRVTEPGTVAGCSVSV